MDSKEQQQQAPDIDPIEQFKPKFTRPENSWQCKTCFGWNKDGIETCYICGADIKDPGIMEIGPNRVHIKGTDEWKAVYGEGADADDKKDEEKKPEGEEAKNDG